MKALVLIKETFRRKPLILAAHLSLLTIYILLGLFWTPEPGQAGAYVMALSGIMLPLALSDGVFGSDILSGRFRSIVTKPIRLPELYVWRVLGQIFQGAIHLGLASCILYGLHAINGKGDMTHFGGWMLCTFLLICAWVVLSSTLSLMAKSEHNSLLLFFLVLLGFVMFTLQDATVLPRLQTISRQVVPVINHVFPPVVFLGRSSMGGLAWKDLPDNLIHVGLQILIYGSTGIVILCRRQYTPHRQ